MNDPLDDIAQVIEEALGMIRKVNASLEDHRSDTAKSLKSVATLLTDATNRISDANQSRMLTDFMLNALIEELVKKKIVSGEAVAARFSANVQKTAFVFEKHSLAQAKMLAEHLSHPGYPDELPRPRGFGPTLIVDNDPTDS
ncbi:hypothetical protein [Agrobacterium larrymoorei]|uniref:hypothetical protein n=1 Tax=Agrobacterium larrymoorei TaxID=160699 RepID=UPI0030C16D9B